VRRDSNTRLECSYINNEKCTIIQEAEMNIRSKDGEPVDPVTREAKKYMLISYGGPGSGGRPGGPSSISAGLGSSLFDLIFEKLGIKKKSRKRSVDEEEPL
jgi:hypothetical protein